MTDSTNETTDETKRGRGRPVGTIKEKVENTELISVNSNNINTIKKAMLEALENNLGNVAKAAEKVRIRRENHYKWLKNDSEYNEKVKLIGLYLIDFVDSKLRELVDSGNITATIYYHKALHGIKENETVINVNMPPNITIKRDSEQS